MDVQFCTLNVTKSNATAGGGIPAVAAFRLLQTDGQKPWRAMQRSQRQV
jgi:hypothetical protein